MDRAMDFDLDIEFLRKYMVLAGFGDAPTVDNLLKRKLMLILRHRGLTEEMYQVGNLSLQRLHDIAIELGL